jgi:hypothetical protein
MEAACERPGRPRLKPSEIDSAGFVVRRVAAVGNSALDQGWHSIGTRITGWQSFGTGGWRMDPDLERRPLRALKAPNGVQVALSRLRAQLEPPAERVTPLFIAPPEVCEKARRTILYGVVSTTSSEERSEIEPVTVDEDVVTTLLPAFLRQGRGSYRPHGSVSRLTLNAVRAAEAEGFSGTFGDFILGLRTLHQVWRVFSAPQAATLHTLLGRIQLTFDDQTTRPLGDYLREAVGLFVEQRPETASLKVPASWPYPDKALARQIVVAARQTLEGHYADRPPRLKRFDERGALYRIHAFVRIRCASGCPPRLHWSAPSEVFTIAPWWENGGPVHTISMPEFDENSVKNVRPNIAFSLPPKLANLLNRMNPEDMLKGKSNGNQGPELGWICSFSLPIITLCAFIVLNIFLSLFHLIFQWMFYIKVCLPFPKKAIPPQP